MKRYFMLLVLALNIFYTVQAQYKAEYFFDVDPGHGNAVQTAIDIGTNNLSLSTANLSEGFHLLGIRSVDAEGRWSPTVSHPVLVTNDFVYAGAEYFVDADPGKGKGISIPVTDRKLLAFSVKTDNLALGAHNLSVRIQHINGTWTDVVTRPFVIVERQMETGFTLEYFYDADPGYGMARQVSVNEGSNIVYLSVDGLSEGMHLMSMRSKDKDGRWSPVVSSPVYVVSPQDLGKAEWFVDTDPGEGKANSIDINGNNETVFTVPTASLTAGNHSLTVRIMTAAGHWLPYTVTPFEVTIKSGIAEVKNVMTVGIRRTADKITLTCGERMDNAHAEIFTVDGVKRGSNTWPAGEQTLSLDVPQQLSPVIVVVKKMDGTRFVKLVK
ncbi:MAG: hypothetical protein Q4F85_16585 [Prevotella sp.]|nr:hypothetical protein [Prevotella sp.]